MPIGIDIKASQYNFIMASRYDFRLSGDIMPIN